MQNIKKQIIISGASGFTGMNLSKLLVQYDYEVYCTKRTSNLNLAQIMPDIRQIDLQDTNQVEKILSSNEIAAVVHLATVYKRRESIATENETWRANYSVGKKLLELALESKAQFLHIESYLQFEELGNTEYLKSKIAFSELIDEERERERLGLTSLIFFDSYGEGDQRNKILDQLIRARREGKSISLEDSKRVIVLTAIQDITLAIFKAIDKKVFGRYRVNGSDKYPLMELAKFIGHFPHINQLSRVEEKIYKAEMYPILHTFDQTKNVIDYITAKLTEDFKN